MLPINFHKTFIPERRLITSILQFSAQGKSGDYQEISAETGIPMGKSSGKVPAMLDYARGMGLVRLESEPRNAVKKPVLTELGRIVFLEDSLLGEPVTQWLAHMNLCRPDIGASAWYEVFGKGRTLLGSTFGAEQLEEYLRDIFGSGKNRTGPLLRTYQDDAALGRAPALRSEDNSITRNRAPTLDEYALPYTAHLLSLLDALFPNQSQVTTQELNERTSWFDACCWSKKDLEHVMMLIERTGYLTIDRQMQPWILERKSDSSRVLLNIYDGLV
jgi:hypothetical protein